jgi:hypothetical protein
MELGCRLTWLRERSPSRPCRLRLPAAVHARAPVRRRPLRACSSPAASLPHSPTIMQARTRPHPPRLATRLRPRHPCPRPHLRRPRLPPHLVGIPHANFGAPLVACMLAGSESNTVSAPLVLPMAFITRTATCRPLAAPKPPPRPPRPPPPTPPSPAPPPPVPLAPMPPNPPSRPPRPPREPASWRLIRCQGMPRRHSPTRSRTVSHNGPLLLTWGAAYRVAAAVPLSPLPPRPPRPPTPPAPSPPRPPFPGEPLQRQGCSRSCHPANALRRACAAGACAQRATPSLCEQSRPHGCTHCCRHSTGAATALSASTVA